MAGRFEGQRVLITGASSGIGAAVARELAREGALVAVAARRADRLAALKNEIEGMGSQALALECDVTDRASIDAAVAQTVEAFGGIDLVLANAGGGVSGPITRLETDDFRRQFETNFFGMLDTIFATLPHLRESKGLLALVGSVSGRIGTPISSPYTASKFAVNGLAECLYYDLARYGVAVSCINPGFVASEIRSIDNRGHPPGSGA
jgi:NAD(P)-dependent dehydrogenase (short-subunit alcohol dehydrogenase family)